MSETKPRGYFEQSSDLTNALILVAPLLVLYEVGLLLTNFQTLNGVDFGTILVHHYAGVRGLVVLNLVVLLGISIAAWVRRRERSLTARVVPLVMLESAFYALAAGVVVTALLQRLPLGGTPRDFTPLEGFFASLGAGVNEELFFRVGLYQTLALILARGKKERATACLVAAVISSVAFSAAHYMGGEKFTVYSFVDRFLFGLLFCGLFEWRGLAITVYTHAIFDIYVLVVLASVPR